ncbi:hypothetical protein CC86DRAFT_451975 [Ophiobolus disseminans]|uniref:Uncharacterized protein n=1 Tax=Ophiobolus disseminans TaxID=1469910 RepID=A0A6A7AHQ5_9PLEO|nr:hypothetical protein CC86DRAFT_451975 [Ophiobolus disseminans]
MLPQHSFIALCIASCTASALSHRRGSANDTAPYSNVTALTTHSPITTVSLSKVSTSLGPSSSLDVGGTVSQESGSAQPTGVRWSDAGTRSDFTPSTPTALVGSTFAVSNVSINSTSRSTNRVSNVSINSTSRSTNRVPNVTINSTLPETSPWSNTTSSSSVRVSNATCTVNIPNASIDYWYPPTYSHALGTMTTKFANYSKTDSYTLVTETATFDAASALVSVYACTWSESYASEWDATYTLCMDYSDQPTAASTSLIYRTAAAPFPPEGSIAVSDARFYDLYSEQPVATHPILVAPNQTVKQVSATPFVHFTAYEVEFGNETKTIQLPSAYAYPYGVKGMEHETSATGPLPEDFLQQVSRADCDAGKLQATITVLIVVDLYYMNWPDSNPFIVHFESSVLGFDDPPVVINNDGTVRPAPFTMGDWDGDLFIMSANPTPVSAKPSGRLGPVPTTQVGNPDNNDQGPGGNEAQTPSIPQPTRVTVGSVGTIPIILQPSSIVVVGSQTLQPGQPAVIVGGVTPVSLVPSATAIVVGGSTVIPIPQVFVDPARPPPLLSVGSSLLTPNAATQFFIAPSQTLTPGGTAVLDGTLISLAPSASFVVVGGSTQLLSRGPVTPSPPQIVVGSTTITALPAWSGSGSPGMNQNTNQNVNQNQNVPQNGASGPMFVVGEQLLVPGGRPITVSGTTLSLVSGGASVVINGVTSAVVTPPAVSVQPAIAIGNSIFTPVAGSGSTFVIADQTLTPGGQAITVFGRVISLAPSASFVVVDGVTSTLVTPAAAAQITPPVLSFGNGIFRPLPGTGTSYLIGSMTLTPGGVIIVADTTISLAPGATALIINGQTSIISPFAQPIVTNAPLLTVGSQTYTAISGTTFIISGQTLTPGGTITVSGTTISLAPGATQLVYGSSGRTTTTALFPATSTQNSKVTGSASPSAGASGRNGQAAATTLGQGSSASASRTDKLLLSFSIAALGWVFTWVS